MKMVQSPSQDRRCRRLSFLGGREKQNGDVTLSFFFDAKLLEDGPDIETTSGA